MIIFCLSLRLARERPARACTTERICLRHLGRVAKLRDRRALWTETAPSLGANHTTIVAFSRQSCVYARSSRALVHTPLHLDFPPRRTLLAPVRRVAPCHPMLPIDGPEPIPGPQPKTVPGSRWKRTNSGRHSGRDCRNLPVPGRCRIPDDYVDFFWKGRVFERTNIWVFGGAFCGVRDCLGTLFRNSLTVGSLKKINNLFIKDIFHGYCLKRQSLNLFAGCGD